MPTPGQFLRYFSWGEFRLNGEKVARFSTPNQGNIPHGGIFLGYRLGGDRVIEILPLRTTQEKAFPKPENTFISNKSAIVLMRYRILVIVVISDGTIFVKLIELDMLIAQLDFKFITGL